MGVAWWLLFFRRETQPSVNSTAQLKYENVVVVERCWIMTREKNYSLHKNVVYDDDDNDC